MAAMDEERPEWLTVPAPDAGLLDEMQALLTSGGLHTVCEGADCPNIGECFGRRTCTFMILGSQCTRNCRFCAVPHGRPEAVSADEPRAVAEAAARLGLRHVVVTSVTRDDLMDGGAAQFAATIRALRQRLPQAAVEVLIPDFQGNAAALAAVVDAGPDIINHNVETVPRLYAGVRPQAEYRRSLALIEAVSCAIPAIPSKSGLMLGLGETQEEVLSVLQDLRQAGCRIVTLGQYLQPSPQHLPVREYVHPETFRQLWHQALAMGFDAVSAGPMVRSSYHAGELFVRNATGSGSENSWE